MVSKSFRARHLHYQVLFEFALLEHELEIRGKSVPSLPLKEPRQLLTYIKNMRAQLSA